MKLYCYIHKPTVIFKALINMATTTYPLDTITFDNVSFGSIDDVLPGMTILFGSAEGLDDLGRQRVRGNLGGGSSTEIAIGRSSRGTVDGAVSVTDNIHITVIDLYQVWAKIPYISDEGEMRKDAVIHINDGDYGTEMPPVANGLPGYAEFVDPDTGVITVDFDSAASFAVATGATIASRAWDFIDGTPSTSTDTTPTGVTFPPGFRYVKLTVTDSNGKTHTKQIPVFAAEKTGDNAPIEKFIITNQSRGMNGQRMTIRVDQSLLPGTYPDGTLVMVWYDNEIGTVTSAPGRSHMAFIGWIQSESYKTTKTKKGTIKTMTLECLDVAGRLGVLPSFPQTLLREATPTKWTEMSQLNIDKYYHYLLYWHSTALELADFYWSGLGSTYPIPILGSNGSSLYDQVDKRAQAIAHKFTCNRVGQLKIKQDPMLIDVADRTATVNMSLTQSDWGKDGISLTKQRPPKTHWGKESAIIAQASDADSIDKIDTKFALAPGLAPSQGVSASTIGEQLVVDLNELLERAGHRYARQNALYGMYNVDVLTVSKTEIDPAEMQWVTLDMNGVNQTYRGLSFTEQRFLAHEVSYSYDHKTGIRTAKATLEKETFGVPAVDVTPIENETELPYVNPYQILPLQLVDPTLTDTVVPTKMLILCTNGVLIRVRETQSGGTPVFEVVDNPGLDTGLSMINDPYVPDTIITYHTGGIRRIPDVWGTSPSGTTLFIPTDLVANGSSGVTSPTLFTGNLINSINRQNYFGWQGLRGNPDQSGWYFYTTDNFATYQASPKLTDFALPQAEFALIPGLFNSMSKGVIYFTGQDIAGGADTKNIFKSTNWGASFSNIVSLGNYPGNALSGDLNIYYVKRDGSQNTDDLFVAVIGTDLYEVSSSGATTLLKDIDYTGDAFDTVNVRKGFRIAISSENGNWQAFTTRLNIHFTDDGWATSTVKANPIGGALEPTCIFSFPPNPDYYIISRSTNMQITFDRGNSWYNIGALYQASPAFATGGAIRAVWADLSEWYSAPKWNL